MVNIALYVRPSLYLCAVVFPIFLHYLGTGELPRTLRGWTSVVAMVAIVCGLVWALLSRDGQIRKLRRTDSLTGLPNRQTFFEDLLKEVTRAQRYKLPLSLAYIDVDNFKGINGHFGNGDGDIVLTRLAYQVNTSVRQNLDMCYRTGADEFAILLPNTKLDEVQVVFDRIKTSLLKASSNLKKYDLVLSIGMVQLKEEENPKHFIDRAIADMLAYRQAKVQRQ